MLYPLPLLPRITLQVWRCPLSLTGTSTTFASIHLLLTLFNYPPITLPIYHLQPIMDYDDLPGVQLITDPRECGIGTKISRPKRTMRPLVEGLRFNHFKHDGKFDTTAKRNLIQDLFLCLSGFEDLWTDPNDPTYGKACFKAYDFHRVGLSDEDFGIPTPFSVRALQIKQERGNRITHGEDAPPLQRPRYGRKCGKIIPRMASFYTCK